MRDLESLVAANTAANVAGPPLTFWYLASPYSKYPCGLNCAFVDVCKQATLLVEQGIPVFSPIAHTHPIALHGGLDPLDHSIWIPADEPFMRAASGLIVLKLDGWKESHGVKIEIDHFLEARKPVVFMTPGIVPRELV